MLFLFSSGGMGISPIIKLSVVNGASALLLSLPRLCGFGTNESHTQYVFVTPAKQTSSLSSPSAHGLEHDFFFEII
jgi:hypothetical protein